MYEYLFTLGETSVAGSWADGAARCGDPAPVPGRERSEDNKV